MTKSTEHSSKHLSKRVEIKLGASRLSSLVDEASSLMDQLSTLSEAQRESVTKGDVEQIIEVVSAREPVVRQIVRVGEEIGAFINDPKMVSRLSDTDRDAALKRIALIEHAMKRLRERDAQDQVRMEEARDGLANQLSGMGAGQSALRAYSTKAKTPNPILQDRKG